jgi:hypothetical protein
MCGADLKDLLASGDGDVEICSFCRDRLRPSDGDGEAHAVKVMKSVGESSTSIWCSFSGLPQGVRVKGVHLLAF